MPFLDDEEQRKQLIKELTAELQDRQAVALSHATDLLGWEVSVSSLHGKIGGKNVTYADCANRQYANFQDFFATWLQGFNDLCELRNVKPGQGGSLSDILILLSDKAIYEYTEIFLERNFIKNYKARVRYKPEESLWKVWFGNSLVFGLFIAPELCPDGTVRTDKSEIRRASYNFWTVGHVATTGLYDPDNKIFIRFNSRNDFFQFYDGILKRLSQSDYERGIYERYINYLSQSADIMSEPLLIPEFRYEGAERSCKYRVDFAVLNPYTGQAIGYELSPASSHMSVSGIRTGKTQSAMNAELAAKWEREMNKRNSYLQRFGMSLVTFTDNDLKSLDACFAIVVDYLSRRGHQQPNYNREISRLQSLQN